MQPAPCARQASRLLLIATLGLSNAGCLAPALIGVLAGGGGAVAGGAAVGGMAAGAGTAAATAGTVGVVAGTTGVVAGTAGAVAVGTAAASGVAAVAGTTAVVGGTAGGIAGVAGAAGAGAVTEVAMVGGQMVAATAGYVSAAPILQAQQLVNAQALASTQLPPLLATGAQFIPNEILVQGLSAQGLAAAKSLGFRFAEAGTLNNLALTVVRLRPPPGMTLDAALAALQKADPEGQYERNPVYRLAGRAAPCQGLRCYPQTLVGWPQGCAIKVRVGMLDGAVDIRHPALASRHIETRRFAPGMPTVTEQEHATAVAVLLTGAGSSGFPGLLPGAELLAADVFSLDAQGAPYTDAARLAAGLDWLAGQQPTVINISLAGPDSKLLHSAIRRIVQSGTGVVAAVGNLGPAAPQQYPAAYAEALGVTAVDRQLKVYAQANRGDYVALAAPGVNVWTASRDGAGQFRNGTSFAAPFVAAAFSVVKAQHPELAPFGVIERLRSGARPLGDDARSYGAGLLQAPTCR